MSLFSLETLSQTAFPVLSLNNLTHTVTLLINKSVLSDKNTTLKRYLNQQHSPLKQAIQQHHYLIVYKKPQRHKKHSPDFPLQSSVISISKGILRIGFQNES